MVSSVSRIFTKHHFKFLIILFWWGSCLFKYLSWAGETKGNLKLTQKIASLTTASTGTFWPESPAVSRQNGRPKAQSLMHAAMSTSPSSTLTSVLNVYLNETSYFIYHWLIGLFHVDHQCNRHKGTSNLSCTSHLLSFWLWVNTMSKSIKP